MAGESFHYDTLNTEESQFRLVTIIPSAWTEEVQCSIKTWSWESRPSYEALSYVWGDAKEKRRIWLNNFPFYVTTNLELALKNLRLKRPRTLWIDAICVNQEDLEERSSQVQLMRRTYNESNGVIVWLGPEWRDTALAYHLILLVDGVVSRPNAPVGVDLARALGRMIENHPNGEQAVSAIYHDLLRRPYWERVWIIQEIAVAPRAIVQCGELQIPWGTFADSVRTLIAHGFHQTEYSETDTMSGLSGFVNLPGIYVNFRDKKEQRITALVLTARLAAATDPRDKIFALSGIATGLKHLIVPSYSPSLTAREVYINFVEHSIMEESSLDVICMSQGRENKLGLPTWVPDLSVQATIVRTPEGVANALIDKFVGIAGFLDEWRSAGNTLPEVSIQQAMGILSCKGIIIDAVIDVGPLIDDLEDSLRPWTTLVQKHLATITIQNPREPNIFSVNTQYDAMWWRQSSLAQDNNSRQERSNLRTVFKSKSMNNGGRYLTGETIVEAYVRTLCTDRLSVPYNRKRRITHQMYWRFWTDVTQPVNQDASTDPASRVDITQSIRFQLFNRKFFISQKGYMGMAGKNLQSGDLVCVLFGCSVPVILRPIGNYYAFVGEAYVHGIMDGQAIQQLSEGRLKQQTFDIR